MSTFNSTLAHFGNLLHLKAFIPWIFQANRNCNHASPKIYGGQKKLLHPFFHEIKVEEPPQRAFTHSCWDVFPDFLHFGYILLHALMTRRSKNLREDWIRIFGLWFIYFNDDSFWPKLGCCFIKEVTKFHLHLRVKSSATICFCFLILFVFTFYHYLFLPFAIVYFFLLTTFCFCLLPLSISTF
jgi:hypothetical protein